MSGNETIEVPDLIHQVTINLPERVKTIRKALPLTDEQRYLAQIFDFGY